MDLSQERSLILEMIAEGKITVDDGEELIQALNASVNKKNTSFMDGFPLAPEIEPAAPIPAIPAIPSIPTGLTGTILVI